MEPKIACIGECMIELSQLNFAEGKTRLGFAGDTLNTALYLARLRPGVSYLTNLGLDAFSTQMLAMFAAEGIDCTLIGRHETRLPGLYSIEVDPAGERSFRYWRDTSAARTLFSGVGPTLQDLTQFNVIYLSGITLAILAPEIRSRLIDHLKTLRHAGHQIVFDSNYRPRLWPDEATARDAFEAMWAATTLALPSFDDEEKLHPGTTPQQVLERIAALGPTEIVLKNGAEGPFIHGQTTPRFPKAENVTDSTGAGDSFNAGYLAARLAGSAPAEAAQKGHALAARVITYPGAVIPRSQMP